jgi:hypothetical protein
VFFQKHCGGPFNAGTKVIEAASEIKNELCLNIPLSKTFPAIDGVLVVPESKNIIYIQCTVSTNHPIVCASERAFREFDQTG